MATRHGAKLSEWLAERGWEVIPPPQGKKADATVRNPSTGEVLSLYDAAERHKGNTGDYPEFLQKEE